MLTITLSTIFLAAAVESAELRWAAYNLTATISASRQQPEAVADAAVVYYRPLDFLVVFGGRTAAGQATDATWLLDMAQRRFYLVTNVTSPESPAARFGCVVGLYAHKMYIFGGCSITECFSDLWSFDIRSFSWERVSGATGVWPAARAFAAGGVYPGAASLYVATGADNDGTLYSDTHVYDLALNTWTTLDAGHSVYSPNKPHARSHTASVMVAPAQLLLFGGCVKHGHCPASDLWMFNGGTNAWSQLAGCPHPSQQAAMVHSPSQGVLLLGGHASSATTGIGPTAIYAYNLTTGLWSIRDTMAAAPSVRYASGVAGGPGGALILFGGIELQTGSTLSELWILEGDSSSESTAVTCPVGSTSLLAVHGTLMFLAFSVSSHLGAAFAYIASSHRRLAVYCSATTVRRVHVTAQVTCGLLAFAGFICALIMIPEQQPHFRSAHGWLGLVIMMAFLAQICIIIGARRSLEWSRALMRVHMWLGLLLLMAAVLNTILGLLLAMAPTGLWLSYFLLVFCALAAYCIAQTMNIF